MQRTRTIDPMSTHTRAAIAAIALTTLIAACGTPEPAVTPPDPTTATATTTPEPAEPVEPAETETPTGAHAYGSTATWDDGVTLSISPPVDYKPSEYAATGAGTPTPGTKYVVVDVTFRNGGTTPVDTFGMSLNATSGDQVAEAVYDSEQKVGPTTARVLPGHTLKWREAWAAPAGGLIITASWNVGGPVSFM